MFQNPSVSPLPDPTTLQAIQQIAAVLHDVDQRIQLLKLALSQTSPQVGALLGAQPGVPQGMPPAIGQPFGLHPYAAGPLGGMGQAPFLHPYAQQIPQLGLGVATPFGQPGVNAPFGFPAQGLSFRPW